MGLLDMITGLLGGSNKKGNDMGPVDMLKDGKIDMNEIKDVAIDQLDVNSDGKLDANDIAGNLEKMGDLKKG